MNRGEHGARRFPATMEFVMSATAIRTDRTQDRRLRRFDPERVIAALKLVRDVFVEAQAMANEASRRYPHFE
jgi:hypothetical protein